MPTQETTQSDHDEILSLLPWFVNQTLENDQKEAVMDHIQTCKLCQSEIEFLSSFRESVQQDAYRNYAEKTDVDQNLSSVMNRIDGKYDPVNAVLSSPSLLLRKLAGIFNLTFDSHSLRWSATALATLFVAFVGFQLFDGPSTDNYSVLSSSDIDRSSMRLSIEVNGSEDQDNARALIRMELNNLEQEADIERKDNNEYIVIFKDSVGVAELSKLTANLGKLNSIARIEILP